MQRGYAQQLLPRSPLSYYIVLTSIVPQYAVLWLSVEVLLLPAVYIVGGIVEMGQIRQEYDSTLRDLIEKTELLNEKYYNLKLKYNALRKRHGN